MTVLHDTFTLEREYRHPVSKVFDAWSRQETKMKWFDGPKGWTPTERRFEFKVGGGEVLAGTHPDGTQTRFVSTLHEIAPGERIVSVYDMYVNGKMLSTSLATLELAATKTGTRLRYTEQGVYFDGKAEGPLSRKGGTEWLLGRLAEIL